MLAPIDLLMLQANQGAPTAAAASANTSTHKQSHTVIDCAIVRDPDGKIARPGWSPAAIFSIIASGGFTNLVTRGIENKKIDISVAITYKSDFSQLASLKFFFEF
jgi:hypothetical protein